MTHLVVETLELDLVLEPLLELGATEDMLNLAQLAVLAFDGTVHHLLVLVGQHPRGLFQHLTIVAVLVSPLAGRDVSAATLMLNKRGADAGTTYMYCTAVLSKCRLMWWNACWAT
jgi:hypothetical protein